MSGTLRYDKKNVSLQLFPTQHLNLSFNLKYKTTQTLLGECNFRNVPSAPFPVCESKQHEEVLRVRSPRGAVEKRRGAWCTWDVTLEWEQI